MDTTFISVKLHGTGFKEALANTARIVKVSPNETGSVITFDRMGTSPIFMGDLEVSDTPEEIERALNSDKYHFSKKVSLTGMNDWVANVHSHKILLVRGIENPLGKKHLSIVFGDSVEGIPRNLLDVKSIEIYQNGEVDFTITPTDKLSLRICP